MIRTNIDPREIARFSAMAHDWWHPRGPFKALHDINPVRLDYVRKRAGLNGEQVLDVGCGGGLLSEAMACNGAKVTGIDMAQEAVAVARRHADEVGVHIDFHHASAESWADTHENCYQIVTCMELVEHVPDPAMLVHACGRMVRPGGDLFFATVNRTPLAYLLVILAAEYLLRIVRRGTHRYAKFIRPEELAKWGRQAGLSLVDLSGLGYLPFFGHAWLTRNVWMNYLVHMRKQS